MHHPRNKNMTVTVFFTLINLLLTKHSFFLLYLTFDIHFLEPSFLIRALYIRDISTYMAERQTFNLLTTHTMTTH